MDIVLSKVFVFLCGWLSGFKSSSFAG